MFADNDYILVLSSKKNQVFIKEDNPSEKVVIVKEVLEGTNIDGIGNLGDISSLVLNTEEIFWES